MRVRTFTIVVAVLGLVGAARPAWPSNPDDDEPREPRRETKPEATYRGPGALTRVGRVLTLGFAARPAPSFGLLDPALQQWTIEVNGQLLGAIEALSGDRDVLARYRKTDADRNPCEVTASRLKTLQRLLGACPAATLSGDGRAAPPDPAASSDEAVRRWLTALERNALKAIEQAAHENERAVATYVLSEGSDWSSCRRIASRVSALERAARACAGRPR